jgi:exonuclease III
MCACSYSSDVDVKDFNGNIQRDFNASNDFNDSFNLESSGIAQNQSDNCNLQNYSNVSCTESLSESECDTFHLLREYKNNHAKSVIISYLNINGLLGKFAELSVLMNDELADIVSIAETKLDDSVRDSVINIKNYKMYRCDGSRFSHGLIMYVRSDITHCRRTDLDTANHESQIIVIEAWLRKQKWFFVSVYKPPPVKHDCFINELSGLCEKMLSESSDILFLGDMNINMQLENNKLNDFCAVFGFKNMVKEPTCFKSIVNESLIDVILVSKPQRFNESLVFDTGLSDCHKMINISTKLHAPKREPRKILYRSFKRFDESAFRKDVASSPFHVSHIFEDVNDVAWFHEKLLLDVINSHAPLKQKTLKKDSVPFMNSEW